MPFESLHIDALALDLGGVLVRVDHGRFCRGLAALGAGSPEEVQAAVFGSDLEPGYDTGRLTSREFYREVRERLGLSLPYSRFRDLWSDVFDPMEGMAEAVARLARRHPLFLVSNTNPWHFRYLKARYPLLAHFRRFILSYRIGSRKPEEGFYRALLQAVGGPAGRCLFVDDKPPFVAAARAHGFRAWRFTGPKEFCRRLSRHNLW
jgi:putative hydrolase of the HAD superfamily